MMRLLLYFVVLFPACLQAHPVSLSWAKVRIHEDRITLHFKILAEDLYFFHGLAHDNNYNIATRQLQQAAADHTELIAEYFTITGKDKKQLPLQNQSVDSLAIEPAHLNIMDLMKYEVHYGFTYMLNDPDWQALTFHQNFDQHKVGVPAVTFLSVSHQGKKLVSETEVTPTNPFTLIRDGVVEPVNPSELTSSYFTITQTGVRHELTLPWEVFHSLTFQPHRKLSLVHQVTVYFQHFNPVHINSNRSTPMVRHVQRLKSDTTSYQGFIYIDLFYPSKSLVKQTSVTWDDFDWRFRWFHSEILTPDSTYRHVFSRFQSKFFWKESLHIVPQD